MFWRSTEVKVWGRTTVAVAVGAAAVATTTTVGMTGGTGTVGGGADTAASERAVLSWKPCPGNENPAGMECSQLSVPVDWNQPSSRKITLTLARLRTSDPAHRMGSVLYHAGGPGPDNVPTLPRYAPNLTELRTRFDVVTWTPRGAQGTWGGPQQTKDCDLSGPGFSLPRNQAEYDATARRNRAEHERCRRVDPQMYGHMDSGQHARDLEAIRAALGEPKLNYIGQSYGAVVGASYGRMFPRRVRTMFFDSAVNHVTDLDTDDALHYQALEGLFSQFVDWCSTTTECALHRQDVRAVWRTLLADADRSPVPVKGRPEVRYSGVDMIRTVPAFLAGERFPALARAIDLARHGDATEITGPARSLPGMKPMRSNSSDATECADGGVYASYQDYARAVADGGRLAPDFPAERAAYHSFCIGWPSPVANPPASLGGKGLPPVLGAAASGDLPHTRVVTDQVPRSTTIAVGGIGHGQYLSIGNPCVIENVNRYFIDGRMPPAGATCPAAPKKG
jgi:pimeloyl-ACP methyl ester carboxylesterase